MIAVENPQPRAVLCEGKGEDLERKAWCRNYGFAVVAAAAKMIF